jgi:hypothetical protein
MPIGGGNLYLISERCEVRLVVIAIILCLMSSPAFAKPEPLRRECNRLSSQIARYEGDVELAQERDNELWENATKEQIARLSERRISRCPEYANEGAAAAAAAAWRKFGQMVTTAAKVAAKYFTMGAY